MAFLHADEHARLRPFPLRGIPSDKLSAIFDPFVQVNKQFTRDHEGVGLGLSISRDLARAMRGDLTVESTLGEGSRFTVALPRGDSLSISTPNAG